MIDVGAVGEARAEPRRGRRRGRRAAIPRSSGSAPAAVDERAQARAVGVGDARPARARSPGARTSSPVARTATRGPAVDRRRSATPAPGDEGDRGRRRSAVPGSARTAPPAQVAARRADRSRRPATALVDEDTPPGAGPAASRPRGPGALRRRRAASSPRPGRPRRRRRGARAPVAIRTAVPGPDRDVGRRRRRGPRR